MRTLGMLLDSTRRCHSERANADRSGDHEETLMHDDSQANTHAQQNGDVPCVHGLFSSSICFHILSL